MNVQEREHWDYEAARESAVDYDRHEAQMGAAWNNDWQNEWLLTSRDLWVRNPNYRGPACPVHPEQDGDDASDAEWAEYHRAYAQYWMEESLWDAAIDYAESRYSH